MIRDKIMLHCYKHGNFIDFFCEGCWKEEKLSIGKKVTKTAVVSGQSDLTMFF